MSGIATMPGTPMPETLYNEMLGRLHNCSHRLLDSIRSLETQLVPVLQQPQKPIKGPNETPTAEACPFLMEADDLLRRLVFLEEIIESLRTRLIL